MSDEDGLICAYLLDGEGGGREVGWPEVEAWRAGQGLIWVHLDRVGARTRRWLAEDSGIDPVVRRTLLQEEVRPRALAMGEDLLVVLRGGDR